MSTLKFSDGVTIKTDGPLRITRKRDGYYVVGQGMCLPVNSREDGVDLIKELNDEDDDGFVHSTNYPAGRRSGGN